MSDPTPPDDPGRPPIADAASLFDSNVVHAYNPPEEPDPPASHQRAGDTDEYGIDTSRLPTASVRAKPVPPATPKAKPAIPKAKPATPSNHFDPSDDDDDEPSAQSSPPTRSDSSIRVERASRHDIDPESDSSDRAPSRSKKRSSDRAIGFEDDVEDAATVAETPEDVDPIWTRGAEWGFDLARISVVAVATLVVAWFALSWSFSLFCLVLLLGGVACVLLSYPLAITIERPVRITPEQAVQDFFAAASHHLPHYRRMWLLLSPTARRSGRFDDFAAFRTTWSKRMAAWKEGKGGTFTPLSFQVSDFRGDKSVGHSTSHVDYTVRVFVRGQENEKPINTYRMTHGLVRGSDRMWYLNQGTLTTAR